MGTGMAILVGIGGLVLLVGLIQSAATLWYVKSGRANVNTRLGKYASR